MPINLRWLGAAGMEIDHAGTRLLVDPFLTRPPMRYLLAGRPVSHQTLIDRCQPASHAVLVTHSHYDHLMDVPYIAARDGAPVYGSPYTIRIMEAYGHAGNLLHIVAPGSEWAIGPFQIRAIKGRHGRVFGAVPFRGNLPRRLRPPLRLAEFRLDTMLSFAIETGNSRLLFWNSPDPENAGRADVLIMLPQLRDARLAALLACVQPSRIIPIHWDNFFSPLDRPISEFLMPGGWPFRKSSVEGFQRLIKQLAPAVDVCIPTIQHSIILN